MQCAAITDATQCAAAAAGADKCAVDGSSCGSTRIDEDTACLADIVTSEQAGTPYNAGSASAPCRVAHQAYIPCVSAANAGDCSMRNTCEWSLAANNAIGKDFCAVKNADVALGVAMKTLGSQYVDSVGVQLLACKAFDDATNGCSAGAAALTVPVAQASPSPVPVNPSVTMLDLYRQCGGTGGNCSR